MIDHIHQWEAGCLYYEETGLDLFCKICNECATTNGLYQEYCKRNHKYIDCPQKGCVYGYCETCNVDYNSSFDCSNIHTCEYI